MSQISVTQFISDEGSVAVFEGLDEDGATVLFAAERRPALAIFEALEAGEDPIADVPDWAILSSRS